MRDYLWYSHPARSKDFHHREETNKIQKLENVCESCHDWEIILKQNFLKGLVIPDLTVQILGKKRKEKHLNFAKIPLFMCVTPF